VHDRHVEVVGEYDDGGPAMGGAETDVVQAAVDPEGGEAT
jgi:hypothetical protein